MDIIFWVLWTIFKIALSVVVGLASLGVGFGVIFFIWDWW